MQSDDSARRIQDMQTVLHGIRAQLIAGCDSKQTTDEIYELMTLMERLLVLNVVDFISLGMARMMMTMEQPMAALERLENILRWPGTRLK